MALPRQPGAREIRYTHLLGAVPAGVSGTGARAELPPQNGVLEQTGMTHTELHEMRAEVEQMRQEMADVRRRLQLLEAKSLPTS